MTNTLLYLYFVWLCKTIKTPKLNFDFTVYIYFVEKTASPPIRLPICQRLTIYFIRWRAMTTKTADLAKWRMLKMIKNYVWKKKHTEMLFFFSVDYHLVEPMLLLHFLGTCATLGLNNVFDELKLFENFLLVNICQKDGSPKVKLIKK